MKNVEKIIVVHLQNCSYLNWYLIVSIPDLCTFTYFLAWYESKARYWFIEQLFLIFNQMLSIRAFDRRVIGTNKIKVLCLGITLMPSLVLVN